MDSGDEENYGSHKIPPKKRHIPKPRPVEELFAEDEKASANYASVANYDDDIEYDEFDGDVARIQKWEDAELHPQILKNLKEHSKYIRPRKIQSATMPFIFDGFDVKVQAETGSGKTLAYLLPIIDQCIRNKLDDTYIPKAASPFALIICPTRELVLQIFEQANKFSYRIKVQIAKAYGEYSVRENTLEIINGCDILIATPGRLRHFIYDGTISVKKIKYLVLDEADTLLANDTPHREGFMRVLKDIINFRNFPDIGDRQTLLFSATFLPEVMENADIFVQPDAAFVTNHKTNPNKRIIQNFIYAFDDTSKYDKLVSVIAAEIQSVGDPKNLRRTIVFTNTKHRSFLAANYLQKHGIQAIAINADKTQDLRENAFNDFREGKINLLVSSDLCCRGLDIKDLDHVINMDMPRDMPTYLYRIGRTGRITQGYATSFISANDGITLEIAQRMYENHEIIPPTLKDLTEGIHGKPLNELFNDMAFGFDNISFADSEAPDYDNFDLPGDSDF